ncbi:MAG: hypothetical protein WCP85_26590 [Mariniphaga sp.]
MKEQEENIENLFGNVVNKQPFRVPEDYFETFADRMKARIAEEQSPIRKKTLYYYLKPALSMAASIALVMLLVYVPIKRFFPSSEIHLSDVQANKDSIGLIPVEFITYFSEGQFLSAVSEMNEIETQKLSPDSLADYIAANYNEYEIIANN